MAKSKINYRRKDNFFSEHAGAKIISISSVLLILVGAIITIISAQNQQVYKEHAAMTNSLSSVFNNVGTSEDSAPATGNYDLQGYSYSLNALEAAGVQSGATFIFNGVSFAWPTFASKTNDNALAQGQSVSLNPVKNATTLGFIGSATFGPSSGTGTIHYTDGSTQSYTLSFSDWTLNAGTGTILPNDAPVIVTTYRNTISTTQSRTVYLFYTGISIDPTKIVASVTLPQQADKGQLHIFALGVGSAFNNEGISSDNNTGVGNLDGSHYSYSNEQLGASGLLSGSTLIYNGLTFSWPLVSAGANDNWQATGQLIPFTSSPHATTLAFLGSATLGPSTGTGTITYIDGTTQQYTLSFTDWTLNHSTAIVLQDNSSVADMTYRNTSAGPQERDVRIFYAPVTIDATKTIQSITLPQQADKGQLHIFSISSGVAQSQNPNPLPTTTATPSPTAPPSLGGYPASDGTIYWKGDWESGTTSPWSIHTGGDWGNSSVNVVTNPVRYGKYAGKLTLNPTNFSYARAEISSSQADTGGYPGQDWFYSFSAYFPSNPDKTTKWGPLSTYEENDFTQWMDTRFQCSPPFQFDVFPESDIVFHYELTTQITGKCGYNTLPSHDYHIGPIVYDQWIDFTVHIKWSTNPSVGYVHVWRNGVEVVPLTHLQTLDPNGTGVYEEEAMYRPETPGTTVIYLDGTRRHDRFGIYSSANP